MATGSGPAAPTTGDKPPVADSHSEAPARSHMALPYLQQLYGETESMAPTVQGGSGQRSQMAKVAMIVGPEYEDNEVRVPLERLKQAGHHVVLLGTVAGTTVRGKRGRDEVVVDAATGDVDPSEFDAMVIPGGHSPDNIRTNTEVVQFVRDFVRSGKPIAAVCHGPQLLIEADAVRGKTMTSWPSVKKDLQNAGATWLDREVVVDGAFITSRKPDDLDAFSRTLLSALP